MAHNHPQRGLCSWGLPSNWSLRLRRCPQVAAQSRDGINTGTLWRTTSHFWSLINVDIQIITKGQRVSLFTSAIPRTTQPKIQNHLRRHLAPSPQLHSTLHYSMNPTLHLTLLNSTQQQLYKKPSSGIQSLSATRLMPSPLSRFNPKDSPPEGRRMIPGHDRPWNRGSPGKKNKIK